MKVKEISSITNVGTTTAFIATENKIPNISNLVKKWAITQKLVKLYVIPLLIMIMINKYITTQEFNKLKD